MSGRLTRRRALRLAGGAVLLGLLVPFLLFAVPELAGADESYVVLSDSMSPTIEAGDVVLVADRDPTTIEEGDVITFRADDPEEFDASADTRLVTHRVVDVAETNDGREFTTRGDANEAPDSNPVPDERVVGVVALTIPLIGRIVSFAGTQLGTIALVVVPCALLAVNEVYELLTSVGETD